MIEDILLLIVDKLSNRDKINFLHTDKPNNNYKHRIFFNDKVKWKDIRYSVYYNNFTYVTLSEHCILPTNIKKINIDFNSIPVMSNLIIPKTTTHIYFKKSVPFTYLRFDTNSLKYIRIKNWMPFPSSINIAITHLRLDNYSIRTNANKTIPKSVNHLYINNAYMSVNIIPETITDVTFHHEIYPNYIPATVKTITLPITYDKELPTHCKIKYYAV